MLTFRCETCGKRIWPWQRYGVVYQPHTIKIVEETIRLVESRTRYWHKGHLPPDLDGLGS